MTELGMEKPHNHYSTLCERCAIEAALDQVSRTALGFKRGWLREVQMPAGELVAGAYFPDALGESLVQDTHRYELEQSPTFGTAYRELLLVLDKKYGHENTKHARAIKQELSREYVLVVPVEPQPAPEQPTAQPRLRTDAEVSAEVMAEGRVRLLESLKDQLSHAQRQYLYGVR
jgi:hypothetical protein